MCKTFPNTVVSFIEKADAELTGRFVVPALAVSVLVEALDGPLSGAKNSPRTLCRMFSMSIQKRFRLSMKKRVITYIEPREESVLV